MDSDSGTGPDDLPSAGRVAGASPVEEGGLTDREAAILPAASRFSTEHRAGRGSERAFLEALSSARLEVTKRLLGALVVDSPPSLPDGVLEDADELDVSSAGGMAETTAIEDRLSRLRRSWPDHSTYLLTLPFPASGRIVAAPVADVHGFDRLRIAATPTAVSATESDPVEHPLDVVDLMVAEGAFPDEEQADRFGRYVDEGVANLAFARLAKRRFDRDLVSAEAVFRSTHTSRPPTDDAAIALERLAAVEGIHKQPAAKIRGGMTPAESTRYAPEFTDRIDLRFVAIPEDHAAETSTSDGPGFAESMRSTFDGLEAALADSLPSGTSPDTYAVLPVHPWQFSHVVPELRRRAGRDRIVPIHDYASPATPLLSFRTVVPHGGPEDRPLPHVKLPLDVFKLHRRNLPPDEVAVGPRLTDLLDGILRDGPFDRLGVLGEYAGASYRPSERSRVPTDEPSIADRLSALFRVNPYEHPLVEDGTVPLTAAGLLVERPGRDDAMVRRFVERYATAEGFSRPTEAATAFLAEYLECVVPGPLRLVSEHGIGLEAHSQNTVVVFDRDARPRAALVRDFGGIRIDTDRFDPAKHDFDFPPGSDVDASEREMYELHYALFFRQIGDLVAVLVREFDVDERACWRQVRTVCEETFDDLRDDPAVPSARVDEDAATLFGDTLEGMAFLTKRIRGHRKPGYFEAANPIVGNRPLVHSGDPS